MTQKLVFLLLLPLYLWGIFIVGLSKWFCGKESTCQCRRRKRLKFDPWLGKIPWRKAWQPIPVFLPGESHGQRSLVGYSPQGHKESDTTTETMHTHIWIGCSLRSSCVFVYLPFTSTWYLKTKESLNETVTMLVWK